MAWYDDEEDSFGDAFDISLDGGFDFGGFDLSNIDPGVFDVDFSNIDFSNIDLGSIPSDVFDFDLGSINFGPDLSNIPSDAFDLDLGSIDFGPDLSNIPSDAFDANIGSMDFGPDLSNIAPDTYEVDLESMFGPPVSDVYPEEFERGTSKGISEIISENIGDAEAQPGGFYGDVYGKDYNVITDPITGMVEKYDKEGNYIETLNAPEVSDVYPDELERGPNAIGVDTSLGTKIASAAEQAKGMISGKDISVGDATKSGTSDDTNTITKIINQLTGGNSSNKDVALYAALLGGILGLLGNKGGGAAPGYKGSIPTYTATRGTPVSPTAGGRRAGGAGLGSLTGGVTYTRAAQGGLMDVMAGQPNENVLMMAKGGQTGRYLRGATDGMADKIYTDIDGQQPARLSHGEFVISADVVSALGQGNSEAGAKKLHDMMGRVRKKAYGRKKQIDPIKGKEVLPA